MSTTHGIRLLISCRNKTLATRHCVPAIHVAGWHGPIQLVHPGDPEIDWEGVAGLLLTTEVMIAEAPKDEEHSHAGPPGGMGGMGGMDM